MLPSLDHLLSAHSRVTRNHSVNVVKCSSDDMKAGRGLGTRLGSDWQSKLWWPGWSQGSAVSWN